MPDTPKPSAWIEPYYEAGGVYVAGHFAPSAPPVVETSQADEAAWTGYDDSNASGYGEHAAFLAGRASAKAEQAPGQPSAEEPERTNRGFSVYARIPTERGGSLRVQQSSQMDGPFLWLFLDGEDCCEHLGRHMKPDPHLSVAGAKQLRDALSVFIRDSGEP